MGSFKPFKFTIWLKCKSEEKKSIQTSKSPDTDLKNKKNIIGKMDLTFFEKIYLNLLFEHWYSS